MSRARNLVDVDPNMKSEKSSRHLTNPPSSSSQAADSDAMEHHFGQGIDALYKFRDGTKKKISGLEEKLVTVEIERFILQTKLKKEKESFSNFKKENDHQMLKLSESNKLLSKENVEIRKEWQKCKDELALKDSRLNDLRNERQKLLKEKVDFNTKLKSLFNDTTTSDSEWIEIQNNDNKRPHLNESGLTNDEIAATKRQKTTDIDATSSDPNDNSTNNLIYGHSSASIEPNDHSTNDMLELFEESEPDDNLPTTEADSMDSVNPRPNDLVVSALEVTEEIKNPIQEKHRRFFRKNIKRVMDFDNLTPETKFAYKQERERKKQYVRKLQRYNETYGTLPGEINQSYKLVLDVDFDTKRDLLTVDKCLSMKLKPHQCQGIQFMWDACFESIEKLQNSNGSGCILGHCMGLGKTLQVIALVHTLLTNRIETKVKKVLIICPVNVILNWVDEFEVWLKDFQKEEMFKVFEVSSCNSDVRTKRMQSWNKNGGVIIIGYRMFQSTQKTDFFHEAFIDPGADLVVCDEGHLLKNQTSLLSLAINKIRTLRRIILTGTPLQNNLKEYFSMVEFVKPRLLGTESEFNNRFVDPITNGQFSDSTEEDIKLMKCRAFILHKLLEGCVQRRDYSVLANFLPPKQEYVLFIRLSRVQIDLYKFYMQNVAKKNPIADLPSLRKVCNHPQVLTDSEHRRKYPVLMAQKDIAKSETNDSIDNESEPNERIDGNEWWQPCSGDKHDMSGKILIFLSILAECEARGEKLLVFSACLSTLNVIEHFLKTITEKMRMPNTALTQLKQQSRNFNLKSS